MLEGLLPAVPGQRRSILRAFAASLLALAASSAIAGGPIQSCDGTPTHYASGHLTFNYDRGNLGSRTKAQADALVTNAISVWNTAAGADIALTRGADLPIDVATPLELAGVLGGTNSVVYDDDGSMIEAMYGTAAKNSVLVLSSNDPNGSVNLNCANYVPGYMLINGSLAATDSELSEAIAHEVGHLIGLDHTQLDAAQGLTASNYPLMYPLPSRTSLSLHEDDAAAAASLYPGASFGATYGTLIGTFTRTDGTAVMGANIWAQSASGATFSVVSDYLNLVNGGFTLHLTPGTYTLHAEPIDTAFFDRFGVGPYTASLGDFSFQPPLYSGANGTGIPMAPLTFGGAASTPIQIVAGCSATVSFHIDGSGGVVNSCGVPAPVAPMISVPTGVVSTTTPHFEWLVVRGATSYELLVQNTSGVAVDMTVASGACTPPACDVADTPPLANATTYNWFVRAFNGAVAGPWSATTTITVNMPVPVTETPFPIQPTGTLTTLTPTYQWLPSPGATSYMLLVQNTLGAVVNTSYTATAAGCAAGSACSVTPSASLAPGATYNWFVNATSSLGTSAWSAATSITAPPPSPPVAPTLVSPAGVIATAMPTYVWNAQPGIGSYRLDVRNGSNAIVDTYVASAAGMGCATGAGTCSQASGISLPSGAYTWTVSADNFIANTPSAPLAFTVSVAVAGPPSVPVPVSPSGTLAITTPAYTWNASSGATSYYLLVQNTAGVAVSTSFTAAAAGCGTGTGTCTVTPLTPLANGSTYNWFVNATNANGTSAWSAVRSVTIDSATAPSAPAVPVTVSPLSMVTTTTPTYTWNASAGATSYYVLVQNTAGVAVSTSVSATSAGCATGTGTCAATPSAALANGVSYNWFVNATNSIGTSAWSIGRMITVEIPAVSGPATPMPLEPAGGSNTSFPTYYWSASVGAASYELRVQNTAGVALDLTYDAASAGCGAGTGTCSATPAVSLTSGVSYNWFVRASNSLGTSPWSPQEFFTVTASGLNPPIAPGPQSPFASVTTTTPTYTWVASTGATSYDLLVQNTAGVAVSLSVASEAAGCAPGSTICSITPSVALANGATYNWFVRAANSVGTSPWSPAWMFMVTAAGPTAPSVPAQVSPSGNTGTTTPTYTWQASAGATSYYLLVQNLSGVAVSMSVNAATAGCGTGSGTCSVTPSIALAAAAPYNWFVNASNSVGTSAWSFGLAIRTP